MLWGAGKGWTAAVALLVAANAVLPNASLVALAAAAGSRLAGIAACAVLATFRWRLGLALLAVWLAEGGLYAELFELQARAYL